MVKNTDSSVVHHVHISHGAIDICSQMVTLQADLKSTGKVPIKLGIIEHIHMILPGMEQFFHPADFFHFT